MWQRWERGKGKRLFEINQLPLCVSGSLRYRQLISEVCSERFFFYQLLFVDDLITLSFAVIVVYCVE